MIRKIHGEEVYGVDVDQETRCAHWNSELDIIAIKFKCCGRWFPCYDCHASIADHPADVWPATERSTEAVLCGACGRQLTIAEYLECDSACPECEKAFNPGCARHYHLYFET
jgi:uncharacterized CHY-type Zn-finger protein